MTRSGKERCGSSSAILTQAQTIPDLLNARVKETPSQRDLAFINPENQWQDISWQEFAEKIRTVAGQLAKAGCRPGLKIGILGRPSLEWDTAQYALLALGGAVVGIDFHDTKEHIRHIIATAEIRGIITDDLKHLKKIDLLQQKDLTFICQITPAGTKIIHPEERSGRTPSPDELSDQLKFPAINPESTATIIFTSGTTGEPKGIAYSHAQILAACKAITTAYSDVESSAHLACWLPLSNLFQRMMNYCAIAAGARTYYVPDPADILKYLPEIKPAVFIGVPRFYEKLYEGITKKIDQMPWVIGKAYTLALKIGYGAAATNSPLLRRLADGLFFKKLRCQLFGGNLHYAISGSAPMPHWLLKWYQTIGILVLEAYGISENIIPIAANTPTSYRFGTVGRILPVNQLRLAEDGEVEVKGPGVFQHYVGCVKEKKVLTPDNYLRTGDEGFFDEEGFLVLKGRKSDFFKTSTGRRVAPTATEKRLQKLPFIDHVILLGAGRKVPIALAAGSREKFCSYFKLTQDLKPGAPGTKQLQTDIKQAVTKQLTEIPTFQQPAALILLFQTFSIAGGELTANLKLKRSSITDKYQELINQAYTRLESNSPNEPLEHPEEDFLIIRL